MKSRRIFPSIRCAMGDWIYYVTCMTFQDVKEWIMPSEEIYKSRKLFEWIQRRLDKAHAKRIAEYLSRQPQRLFNSLVVGVHGAQPEWAALSVSDPRDELTDAQEDMLESTLGILRMTGEEKLFAIDGQHRVVGIKEVLKSLPARATEEIAVLLVAHLTTDAGRARTRRLFTTLNRSAKKVSPADIVALDEDNGLAVVTRRLVDEFPLFLDNELILYRGTAALPDHKTRSLTTILGLFEVVKQLYPDHLEHLPSRVNISRSRPSKGVVEEVFELNWRFWTILTKLIPEYKAVLIEKIEFPGAFRTKTRSHLLFRPVGQAAFAGAVGRRSKVR